MKQCAFSLLILLFALIGGLVANNISRDESYQNYANESATNGTLTISPTAIGPTLSLPPGLWHSAKLSPPPALWHSAKLPETWIPKHYNLKFETRFYGADKQGDWNGEVEIEIEQQKAINYIVLNQKGLFIEDVTLWRKSSNDSIPITKHYNGSDFDLYFIEFGSLTFRPIDPFFLLTIKYRGVMDAAAQRGFYQSIFVDYPRGNNTDLYKYPMASTQFEANHAREAFPCFDNPNLKATFQLSLTHSSDYQALTNTPIKQKTDLDRGRTLSEFERTSNRLSTYLIAFAIVRNYTYFNSSLTDNGKLKVTTGGPYVWSDDFELSADVGRRIINYLDRQTKVDYAFAKLDQISMPKFASAAMENWGLVIYNEIVNGFDKEDNTAGEFLDISGVVIHEVVHQWYGNLVTLKWWDHLWLNEAYASYLEFPGMENVHENDTNFNAISGELLQHTSGYRYMETQNFDEMYVYTTVMKAELPTYRNMFSATVYKKGALFHQMFHDLVGDDLWWQSQQKYLKEFEFKNANTNDHLKVFDFVIGEIPSMGNLLPSDLMKPYLYNVGYPLVKVQRIGDKLRLTQELFRRLPLKRYVFGNRETIKRETAKSNWNIPISYKRSTDASKVDYILLPTSGTVELPITTGSNAWTHLNGLHRGMYRVLYDEASRKELIAATRASNVRAYVPL